MPQRLEPKLGILPEAQQQIWPSLAPASELGFVLYGGTAVALHLGHRTSVDFDFFRAESLDKEEIRSAFPFARDAAMRRTGSRRHLASGALAAGTDTGSRERVTL
jgi:hypothetical protein